MGNATGTEIKAAIAKAAAWGTPVELGANHGILILPHSLKKARPVKVDDSLGLYHAKDADLGEIKVEGDIPAYLRYDGLDLLIALVMGATAGAPTQPDAVNDPNTYQQTFTLADHNDGLFATFGVNNQVNIDEYTTLKITGFTLKGSVGNPLEIAFHVLVHDRLTNSSTNTMVTFANVTYFETGHRVLFNQRTIRINAQDGAALGGGDEIYPSSFELVYKRAQQGVYGSGAGADNVDEPTNDEAPECTLTLDFPRYTTAQYFEDWDAKNLKKLDMVFAGKIIDVNYQRTFKLQFPNLMHKDADLPIEKGILKHPLQFICLACDSAPTGMAGITKPFQVDVTNRQSANVLA